MKKYLFIYAVAFTLLMIVFTFLSIAIFRRTEIVIPFTRVVVTGFIMTVFISLSVFFFRLEKGNSIVNTVIGFIILLPDLIIMRRTFGDWLFRFSSTIYLLAVLVAIIYSAAVIVVSRKAKKEEANLNRLLKQKQKEEDEAEK